METAAVKPIRRFSLGEVEIVIWPFRGNEIFHSATVHAYYMREGKRVETTQFNAIQLLALAHLSTLASDWIREHQKKEFTGP